MDNLLVLASVQSGRILVLSYISRLSMALPNILVFFDKISLYVIHDRLEEAAIFLNADLDTIPVWADA